MSRPSFDFFGSDFRSGVRKLKPDEIGGYIMVLTLIYEGDGVITDDDHEIAAEIGFDVRVWRRVRARLVSLGKLIAIDGTLRNAKADRLIAKRDAITQARAEAGREGGKKSGQTRRAHRDQQEADEVSGYTSGEDVANLCRTSSRSSDDLSRNFPERPREINETDEANAKPYLLSSTEEGGGGCTHAREREDGPPDWRARLTEAQARADGAINLTVGATQHAAVLRSLVEPTTGEPCDWERDVLPAIDELAASFRARGALLRAWTLVRDVAIRNRDRRLAGLPEPTIESLTDDASARTSRPIRRTYADEQRAASDASLESWGRVLTAIGAG